MPARLAPGGCHCWTRQRKGLEVLGPSAGPPGLCSLLPLAAWSGPRSRPAADADTRAAEALRRRQGTRFPGESRVGLSELALRAGAAACWGPGSRGGQCWLDVVAPGPRGPRPGAPAGAPLEGDGPGRGLGGRG